MTVLKLARHSGGMRFSSFLLPVTFGFCVGAYAPRIVALDDYELGPESARKGAVPRGTVTEHEFTESKVFPGTFRKYWVYVPAQYDGSKPAALMVFQDGHAYVSETGQMRVPVVLDNLIHQGDLPPIIGLFVNPGHVGEDLPDNQWRRNNRSFEYDTPNGDYARFLIDELIPQVAATMSLNISERPADRAICGMSSGGICAFTVAWERSEEFGKVLSHIGSFVNIRGGHVYPALIRKTERKPIRIFLQDGTNDLDNVHGNWPLANRQMASALRYMGYDHKVVFGDGGHNGKHGGAILPDSLRWLWRPAESLMDWGSRDDLGGDQSLPKVRIPGADWELIGDGYSFTDGACADVDGNFYFSDLPNGTVYRMDHGGSVEAVLTDGPRISGMKFAPDGRLIAATQGPEKRIVSIDLESGAIQVLAEDVRPNDLVVTFRNQILFTDTAKGQVLALDGRRGGRVKVVAEGINKPNGISLSRDQSQLAVSEYGGSHVWVFRLTGGSQLLDGSRYMTLRTPPDREDSGGDGMTIDRDGRYYVTSWVGIQMFDATGRPGGVLLKPTGKACVSAAFAGPEHGYLYVCAADQVFRRKVQARGLVSYVAP